MSELIRLRYPSESPLWIDEEVIRYVPLESLAQDSVWCPAVKSEAPTAEIMRRKTQRIIVETCASRIMYTSHNGQIDGIYLGIQWSYLHVFTFRKEIAQGPHYQFAPCRCLRGKEMFENGVRHGSSQEYDCPHQNFTWDKISDDEILSLCPNEKIPIWSINFAHGYLDGLITTGQLKISMGIPTAVQPSDDYEGIGHDGQNDFHWEKVNYRVGERHGPYKLVCSIARDSLQTSYSTLDFIHEFFAHLVGESVVEYSSTRYDQVNGFHYFVGAVPGYRPSKPGHRELYRFLNYHKRAGSYLIVETTFHDNQLHGTYTISFMNGIDLVGVGRGSYSHGRPVDHFTWKSIIPAEVSLTHNY